MQKKYIPFLPEGFTIDQQIKMHTAIEKEEEETKLKFTHIKWSSPKDSKLTKLILDISLTAERPYNEEKINNHYKEVLRSYIIKHTKLSKYYAIISLVLNISRPSRELVLRYATQQ